MTEHSPTPWRINDDGDLVDANNRTVYEPGGPEWGCAFSDADLQHIVDCVNRCHHHDSDQHDYRFTRQVPQSGAWIFECECGDSIARFGERGQTPPVGSPL